MLKKKKKKKKKPQNGLNTQNINLWKKKKQKLGWKMTKKKKKSKKPHKGVYPRLSASIVVDFISTCVINHTVTSYCWCFKQSVIFQRE